VLEAVGCLYDRIFRCIGLFRAETDISQYKAIVSGYASAYGHSLRCPAPGICHNVALYPRGSTGVHCAASGPAFEDLLNHPRRPEMFLFFLIGFVVLLLLGLPVAVGLGGAAFLYFIPDGFFTQLIQTTYAGIASFSLLAIPLFMLAGNLMSESGITEELANFARLLLGHIRGGLGMATIFASAIFAAITGSAVATVVAIGGVMIPTMVKSGYDEDVAGALTATSACLGLSSHPAFLYHPTRYRHVP